MVLHVVAGTHIIRNEIQRKATQMKKALAAAALALAATSANAGSADAPKMDVTVISQSASGGMSQGWIVPMVFAGLLIVLLGNAAGGGYSPG